jgi:dGTPase
MILHIKAGFLSPVSMLAVNEPLAKRVVSEVSKRLQKAYPHLPKADTELPPADVYLTFAEVFEAIWSGGTEILQEFKKGEWGAEVATSLIAAQAADASKETASSGYYRSRITSDFVGGYIRDVKLAFDKKRPIFSKVYFEIETFKRLEILKNYAFQALIMSPMLKVAEYRGKDIVKQIFRAISDDDGYLLMPSDFQELYFGLKHPAEKQRAICDFIAGMTDRYAVQFYGRLFGTNPETIFSPL